MTASISDELRSVLQALGRVRVELARNSSVALREVLSMELVQAEISLRRILHLIGEKPSG